MVRDGFISSMCETMGQNKWKAETCTSASHTQVTDFLGTTEIMNLVSSMEALQVDAVALKKGFANVW